MHLSQYQLHMPVREKKLVLFQLQTGFMQKEKKETSKSWFR